MPFRIKSSGTFGIFSFAFWLYRIIAENEQTFVAWSLLIIFALAILDFLYFLLKGKDFKER